tara:strand:- start:1546 stop:2583 length:1038 start_codon:yes stop_codon:yes gene_type:complete
MEPQLSTNDNGYYEVKYYDEESKHVRRQSFRTKDAVKAHNRFALWLVTDNADSDGIPTIEMILDRYDTDHIETDVADKERERLNIRWLNASFGPMTPDNLDNNDVKRYISDRKAGRIGRRSVDGTIRRELTTLVSALNHGVREKILKLGDVPHIKKPKDSPPRTRYLSETEIKQLIKMSRWDGATHRFEDGSRKERFIRIALETGARKGAIESLTWDRVNFKTGIINFQAPFKTTTKKRNPKVPISDDLLPFLIKWKKTAKTEFVLVHDGDVRRTYHTAADNADIKNTSPHILRHTWASHAAMNGVDLVAIAGVLGNTYQVVAKTYAHLSPSYLRDAINHKNRNK